MKFRLQELFNRCRAFFRKRPLDDELDVEMAAHLEFAIEENLRRGLSPQEARRQALVSFGAVAQAEEGHREARGLPALDILMQDFRHTLQALRRDRAFTLVAVLILAAGIGGNIAVFSVVNAILLRPLPFRDPQQLAWLAANYGVGGLSDRTYEVDAYTEIQRHSRSFHDVTAFVPYFDYSDFKLAGYGEPRPVSGIWVAGNFFDILGIQPALGRLFTHEESVKGGRAAIVLGHGFWQRQFGADPAILGRGLVLNNRAYTVVGVMPETFDFAAVFAPGTQADFFVPIIMDDIRTYGHMLSLIGRLNSGVSLAQATTEVGLVLSNSNARTPDWLTDIRTTASGLKEHISGKLRRSLIVLWCGVGLMLLIVCVNLSNLLLARAAARGKEFAMRCALGAGRSRLVRQLLTESLTLSGAGALLGLGLAALTTRYLAHQGSIALPLLSGVRVDGAGLGWTLLIVVATTLLFGIVPALGISGVNLHEALKDTGRGMTGSNRHEGVRGALVICEVALACVLLTGTGLLFRSFLRVLDVDLGFQPTRASAIKVDYDDGGSRERRGTILKEILERISALPGVQTAGMSDKLPLDRNRSWGLRAKGRTYPTGWNDDAFVNVVTPAISTRWASNYWPGAISPGTIRPRASV